MKIQTQICDICGKIAEQNEEWEEMLLLIKQDKEIPEGDGTYLKRYDICPKCIYTVFSRLVNDLRVPLKNKHSAHQFVNKTIEGLQKTC